MPGGSITSSSGTAHNFITLKGQGQSLSTVVEEISRPGIDGHAYRTVGKRGMPYELVGIVDVDDLAEAIAEYVELRAMQGTLVSVVDDYGANADPVMCLEVIKLDVVPLLRTAGGLSDDKGALLIVKFLLQNTQAPLADG